MYYGEYLRLLDWAVNEKSHGSRIKADKIFNIAQRLEDRHKKDIGIKPYFPVIFIFTLWVLALTIMIYKVFKYGIVL